MIFINLLMRTEVLTHAPLGDGAPPSLTLGVNY